MAVTEEKLCGKFFITESKLPSKLSQMAALLQGTAYFQYGNALSTVSFYFLEFQVADLGEYIWNQMAHK